MARIKAKARPVIVAANDPTPERMRRDDWLPEDAPFMPDDTTNARRLKVPRRLSRALRFRKDGWTDDAGAASLLRYELLVESSGYGHTRSCIDNSPRGGAGDMPQRVIRARVELASVRNGVVRAGVLAYALMVTHELLFAETPPDVTREQLVGGPRERCLAETRGIVGAVASALTMVFDARMAA